MIDGSVKAATTPIMPRVMRTSARVKATFFAAKQLGSQATKFLDVETGLDAKSK